MSTEILETACECQAVTNLVPEQVGLDYLHGTGHGVGSFLNVHEGPCGISYRWAGGLHHLLLHLLHSCFYSYSCRVNLKDPGLQEGMILSDEPGVWTAPNSLLLLLVLLLLQVTTKQETLA